MPLGRRIIPGLFLQQEHYGVFDPSRSDGYDIVIVAGSTSAERSVVAISNGRP